MNYAAERRAAVEAVVRGCRLCRRVAPSPSATMSKDDRSPVTVADFGAQAVVNSALADVFPRDPIVAEEDAATLRRSPGLLAQVTAVCGWNEAQVLDAIDRRGTPADRFWVLDPIDGTKGFLRGGQYAVALALIERGTIVLGVLGCPNLDALFIAVRGQGAVQRSFDGIERTIRVTPSREPQFIESVDASHSDHSVAHRSAALMGATRVPIRMDSQAKYGIVARGEASVYLRVPTRAHPVENIWDHAPGAIVVEEAGGRVTDVRGAPPQWCALDRNEGIVATNGALHDAVIEAVRRVRSG